MRKKVQKMVVSFFSTTQAMAAERYFLRNEIPGRLIPLPGAVSAECGLAWCADLTERTRIETLIKENQISIQGIHEVWLYEQRKDA